MSNSILVVEDDFDVRNNIGQLLRNSGYMVSDSASGEEAIKVISEDFDLVILDVMMPGMTGFDVCRSIRKNYDMPILFLTARDSEKDKVEGLDAGGDDYLVKPFSHAELIARVKAIMRRREVYDHHIKTATDNQILKFCDFTIDISSSKVYKGDSPLNLTDKEFDIFVLLINNRHKALTPQFIFENVWDEKYIHSSSNTIMVHIRNLRKKIEENPDNPKIIKSFCGKGYKVE